MTRSRPNQPMPDMPATPPAAMLALWTNPLEDTPYTLQAEAGRFAPEPWQLTPAERGAPPG